MGNYRQRASAHTKHAFYCSCGKVVHGNGGKAGHAYMHEQAKDGHQFVGSHRYWDDLLAVATGLTFGAALPKELGDGS